MNNINENLKELNQLLDELRETMRVIYANTPTTEKRIPLDFYQIKLVELFVKKNVNWTQNRLKAIECDVSIGEIVGLWEEEKQDILAEKFDVTQSRNTIFPLFYEEVCAVCGLVASERSTIHLCENIIRHFNRRIDVILAFVRIPVDSDH